MFFSLSMVKWKIGRGAAGNNEFEDGNGELAERAEKYKYKVNSKPWKSKSFKICWGIEFPSLFYRAKKLNISIVIWLY